MTPATISMTLTHTDQEALESLEHKQTHLRDSVRGLVEGYDTGLFVWGEGGIGKSWIVGEELGRLRAPVVYHNSRMTGRGLVDALGAAPNCIHWIEDAETLFDDKNAHGVIRSACWSQSKARPPVREVTWTSAAGMIRFDFTGGILVISNANLSEKIPAIRAIKTRVKVLNMDVTMSELIATIKKICAKGYVYGTETLKAAECWAVGRFIIETMSRLHRQPDLRLLKLGFHDFMMERNGLATLPWQQLLTARMQEKPGGYQTRAARAAESSAIALKINAAKIATEEKLKMWRAATGMGKAAFYKALKRA